MKFFFSIVLALSLTLSFPNLFCQGFDLKNLIFVDYLIERTFMPMNKVPGVGLAIVNDGETLYARGYGNSDLVTEASVDNNTLFLIASITKTFTATLVVKVLHEKFPELGAPALDTPIHKLLQKSTILSDRYRSESITFRDLLSHRACLEPMDYGFTFGAYSSSAEVVNRTKYAKEFQCAFREFGVYNNGLYALAGELISEIAGSNYKTLMNGLFSELGMTRTSLISDAMDYDVVENIARAYYYQNGTPKKFNSELYKRITKILPAGGIITNAVDMGEYMKFRLSFGKVGGVTVVPEDVMKWMQEPALSIPFNGFRTNSSRIVNGDYALGAGIALGIYDGYAVQSHGGSFSIFNSRMSLYPDLNLGIFSVINGPGELDPFFDQKVLHEGIFDIILEFYPRSNSQDDKQTRPKPKAPILPKSHYWSFGDTKPLQSLDISEMEGSFGNPVHGEFQLILNETVNALYLNYGKWGTGFILPVDNSTNVYLLELDSDLIGDFISQTPNQEILPELFFQLVNIDTVNYIFGELSFEFKRNANMETYPPQLWDPTSCGPVNIVTSS